MLASLCIPNTLFTLQDPNTVPGWSLSTRRSHILRILEQVLSVLGSMEDSWQSWRQASAQSEAHLQSHLVGNQDQYGAFCQVCSARHYFVLEMLAHVYACATITYWMTSSRESKPTRQKLNWASYSG